MFHFQSFSLWALASVFEFLNSPVFHQLVSSMTTAIDAQARASFSAATFLKQIRRETLISHAFYACFHQACSVIVSVNLLVL